MRFSPLRLTVALLALSILSGSQVTAQIGSPAPDSVGIDYRLFLVGDTGSIDSPDDPVLALLRSLGGQDSRTAAVFLGDNIYGRGLPPRDDPDRATAERLLQAQLDGVREFAGTPYFIPGNHDWDDSGPLGPGSVRRQDAYVDSVLGRTDAFVPDDALPGPTVIDLDPGPVLVVFDSEWWLREGDKPFGETGKFEIREEGDLLAAIDEILLKEDDRPVVVAAHHPLYSNGPHGGRFPLRTHLFPLTDLAPWAYVPLPIVGSLYPLFVSWIGGRQDIAHRRYASLREGLETVFSTREELLVYASGHDHSLQHFPRDPVHFVVSGSGSRPSHVSAGRGAAFVSDARGLMELRFHEDGSVDLIAWSADDPSPGRTPLYRSRLQETARSGGPPLPDRAERPTDTTRTVTAAIAPSLAAGPLHRFFLGSHHRMAWTTPVEVPVLRIGEELGGLRPTARGGGMQTLSIRLESQDGHEYVLRSLTKDPTRTLPQNLEGTIARDVVMDQVSIIHPFGALLVPELARAVGIFHTNPRAVYVPDDPLLAPYTEAIAGRIMLLEERPDDDMSHAPSFGRSDDVVSSGRMLREVTGDNDHRVDQAFLARARLFDMLIADWDRHPDQWRWATFEPADSVGRIYRPIGRDRDWAFNWMDGVFPTLIRSPFGLDKFQVFGRSYGRLRGLNRSGMDHDRRFTAALSREDWIDIGRDMVDALDDATIDRAIRAWPESIQALYAQEFEHILRIRRDKLPEVAAHYHDLLSPAVDVVGSDKHESFTVSRPAAGVTEVEVWAVRRDGEPRHRIYRRRFEANATSEIRLYGLDGSDRFVVQGIAEGTTVFVVGGRGDDHYRDETSGIVGHAGSAVVFDTHGGMDVTGGPSTRDRRSSDPLVNRYDPHDYPTRTPLPRLFLGHNPEDGAYVGGGITLFRERFRHAPYAARHTLLANVAGRTGAFNIIYRGHLVDALGSWNASLNAEIRSPRNVRNFFGLGNETSNRVDDREFYQARYSRVVIEPALEHGLGQRSALQISPFVSYTYVRQDDDRFVGQPQAGIDPQSFSNQWHGGVRAATRFDRRDRLHFPRYGFLWDAQVAWHRSLTEQGASFGSTNAELRLYHTPGAAQTLTVAGRIGIAHRMGTFPFYASSTLGGNDNLRGWRGTRFAGRTALWQGLEARLRLGRFASLLANGAIGVLAFIDQGRVWTDGERSRVWHRGFGGGVWAELFDAMVVTSWIGRSEEQTDFTLQAGFFF